MTDTFLIKDYTNGNEPVLSIAYGVEELFAKITQGDKPRSVSVYVLGNQLVDWSGPPEAEPRDEGWFTIAKGK